jgi:hypothetical protein
MFLLWLRWSTSQWYLPFSVITCGVFLLPCFICDLRGDPSSSGCSLPFTLRIISRGSSPAPDAPARPGQGDGFSRPRRRGQRPGQPPSPLESSVPFIRPVHAARPLSVGSSSLGLAAFLLGGAAARSVLLLRGWALPARRLVLDRRRLFSYPCLVLKPN